ncbi:unnamed protein product [Mesocestoides corti]|uniref:Serine/threonine-protein kinase ATR n=1 Tax=Mesocestoides corti TaxID=53468 RepID=A0A3P6G7F6_MESCO|nr:unnamed protein product [Mesocestoides corti]
MSHSSRPVRRICLASLVANAGGGSQYRQGLMQLSRLVVRALHANRSPDVGPVTSEGDACAAPSSVRALLSKLMTCLLGGLSRDSDREIRLLYAQWLGALGVIDPSRLSFTVCPSESTPVGSVSAALNWAHLFPFDVLMELAKIYMRAASPKQLDSAALAIQELLRLFAVPGTSLATAANLPDISRFISGTALWTKFSQSVQDLFIPLLNSKYAVEAFTDWNSIETPIFGQDSCQSYESWIRLWCGSLKVHVLEPATNRMFQVCEPVIKSDMEFARYLLHPVALQVLIEGSQVAITRLRAEVLSVLETVADAEQPGEQTAGSPADFLIRGLPHIAPAMGSPRRPWRPWYPLAAQTVFSLLDYLSEWHRARSADHSAVVTAIARAAGNRSGGGFKPTEDEKARLTELNLALTRVSEFFESLAHTVQARASLRIGGLARALRHWELAFSEDEVAQKALYVSGFIDRQEAPPGPLISQKGQESLLGILETFTALHDTDGLVGVLAQMQQVEVSALSATTDNDSLRISMLRALQLENEDQLDMACATYEHALATFKGEFQPLGLHAGLFRCQLPDPARLQALIARTDALLTVHPPGTFKTAAWTRKLNEYRTEAVIRLADWEKLDQVVSLALRSQQRRNFLDELRLSQMNNLATAALEGSRGYLRACEPLVKLSLLTEVEGIIGLGDQLAKEIAAVNRHGLPTCRRNSDVCNMLSWLEARLQQSGSALHTLEPVLAIRHSTIQLISAGLKEAACASRSALCQQLRTHQIRLLDSALANSWLQRAKLARRAGQFMAAYTCVLNAERCGSPGALTERAKLLWQTGKREAALTCLDEGLRLTSAAPTSRRHVQPLAMPPPVSRPGTKECSSKSPVSPCAQQTLLLRARYCEETSRFDFDTTRHLYSDICETFSGCEEAHFRLAHYVDEARNSSGSQHDLLLKVALEHYGKALACGSQFIYQSMPRFLTLWLDYGAEVAKTQKQSSIPSNIRCAGDHKSTAVDVATTFDEVQNLMRQNLQKIPPYQFYTALGQILSRVCHEHPNIIKMLIDLIVRIFVAYPQQTIWFLMSLHNSTVTQRRERAQQIFASVMSLQNSLAQFLSDCIAFCAHLKTICDLFVTPDNRDVKSFSISQAARPLTRLLEKCDFSQVLIPVHRQLVPALLRPRAPQEEVRSHLPFGPSDRFVCLARLEDKVEILGSQTRPKKMIWIGSDGRRYVIVAKPNDDLRKDSRLMDMNSIINKFLLKNPETRHRALQIRTYAVIPLSENGGLIEWACNTQPFRSILTKLYAEIGRPFNWMKMNQNTPQLDDPLEYEARETFARTCAVMSMVGYVLGLGDRHTENILFDCTTGGLVHVDFSCVFNNGLTLPWPERVPFRLTRNLVHAMGPTGYEGTFRRCAEVTMRLLRREIDPLMAVFRPIYFDALVEQGGGSRASDDSTSTRRSRRLGHEVAAIDKVSRAAMEKLTDMEDRLRGKITEHDDFSKLLPMSVEGQVARWFN